MAGRERARIIFTLGTSTREIEQFITLLREHSVQVVVDVRRFPTSRFEHFKKANLAELLSQAGIGYTYMGSVLGGYRHGGYQRHMQTDEFKNAMDRLEKDALEKRTAVVCAERFPWRCHRKHISQELERRNWQVVHIIDPGKTWRPGEKSRPNDDLHTPTP